MVTSKSGIVLLKGKAGLGNRILALLTAILYSKLANRHLLVDWRDGMYADSGVNAFPLLFSCRSASALVEDLPSGSVHPWMWIQGLGLSAKEMERLMGVEGGSGCPFTGEVYSFDPRCLHYQEDVLVMWSLIARIAPMRRHFHGPWRHWRALADDQLLARLLKEELEVHPAIQARCAEVQHGWLDRPRIGIHVRHSDRTTNLNRLRRRVAELRQRHPEAVLFLATDSQAVLDDFQSRFGEVLTVPKWLPESGPLHQPSGACPDRLAMARAALVDMRLLASCDQLIVNENSSFSLITRLLWQGIRDADRAGVRRHVRNVATLGSIPFPLRERVWRSRDRIVWTPWLWQTRRQFCRLQESQRG